MVVPQDQHSQTEQLCCPNLSTTGDSNCSLGQDRKCDEPQVGHSATRSRNAIRVAIGATAVGLLIRGALWPIWQNNFPYITYFPVVMLVAYRGGLRPGLLATFLSAASVWAMYLVQPLPPLTLFPSVSASFLFILVGSLISWLSEVQLQAVERANSEAATARQAEARIRDDERRFRGLAESLPQLVWTARQDGNCDYLSKQWCDYTGVPEAPQLGSGWMDVVHPDDRERLDARWSIAVDQASPFDIDFRIRSASGEYRWFKTRGVPVRNEQGQITHWVGSNTDIEDAKRAEEWSNQFTDELELRVAERTKELSRTVGALQHEVTERQKAEESLASVSRHLQAVLAAATEVSVIATDSEGVITVFNSGAERMLGYSAEEMIGKQTPQLIHVPAEVAEHGTYLEHELGMPVSGFDVFVARARHGSHDEREWTYVRKDGSHLSVSLVVTALRDDYGTPIGFLGAAIDVTKRKCAEMALRESEERFRLLVDGVKDYAIYRLDPEGRVVTWNEGAERITGYTAQEIIGQHVSVFQPVEDIESHRTEFELHQALRHGRYEGERLRVRKDGGVFWCAITLTPLFDSTGNHLGFAKVTRDITQRKMAEEELRRAKQMAEAANQAKSEFLANMSHEIRTPMNGILGMTGLALDTDLTPMQHELLTTVKTSADSLLTVINDILDYSKIEAGKLDLDPQPFSLRDGLGDLLKPLGYRAQNKELELVCHVSPATPDALVGDLGRLRQILVNLVGNALKFTDRGEVVVRVETEESAADGRMLHFSVSDTGIGIPSSKLTSIFEPFSQADASTTRTYGGTGLGLTISRRLVELMGGRIWADSQPGTGSTFHFLVKFEAQTTPMPSQRVTLPATRVIVAVANETSRTVLIELLTSWGPEVVPARNLAEVLQLAEFAGSPYAAIVLDTSLAGLDNETHRLGLSRLCTHKSPIILLAGNPELAKQYREDFGPGPVLGKPPKYSDLFDALRDAAGNQTTQRRPAAAARENLKSRNPLRVLLAEDNAVNVRLATLLLAKQGHMVQVVGTGRAAVEAFEHTQFDVILMDMQMPEMDGLEATAAIRQREQLTGRHVAIIALTANAMKGDRQRCLDAGMDGYISKPIEPHELFSTLEQISAMSNSAVEINLHEPFCVAQALDLLDGDADILLELIDIFEKTSPAVVSRMSECLKQGDAVGVCQAGHNLKGAAAVLGARKVVDLAAAMEAHGADARLSDSLQTFELLQSEMDELLEALATFHQEARPTA